MLYDKRDKTRVFFAFDLHQKISLTYVNIAHAIVVVTDYFFLMFVKKALCALFLAESVLCVRRFCSLFHFLGG